MEGGKILEYDKGFILTGEYRKYWYMRYYEMIDYRSIYSAMTIGKEWNKQRRLAKIIRDGGGIENLNNATKGAFCEFWANFIAQGKNTMYEGVSSFVETREPLLRTRFCEKYLAPMLIACMRGGWAHFLWWLAKDFGFQNAPRDYDGTPVGEHLTNYNAFPYTSVSQMTEEDRRAFLLVVESVYWSMLNRNMGLQYEAYTDKITEDKETVRAFTPYPKDGFTAEEILEHSNSERYPFWGKDYKGTIEDIYDMWEFEPELYFPIVINRAEEAIYYALKFKGQEYVDYIDSLNVEEDFNYQREEQYNEVMKEGYKWHSEE